MHPHAPLWSVFAFAGLPVVTELTKVPKPKP